LVLLAACSGGCLFATWLAERSDDCRGRTSGGAAIFVLVSIVFAVSTVWLVSSAMQVLAAAATRDDGWLRAGRTAALAPVAYVAISLLIWFSLPGVDRGLRVFVALALWLLAVAHGLGWAPICDE
jgi:hypothetical protein